MIHEKIDITPDYRRAGAVQPEEQPYLVTYLQRESPELVCFQKRSAVIICPGGAYGMKSDREAEVVAFRYLAAGFHAFVLQYSVAPSRYPCALLELGESVALVRSRAGEWRIDPDRIFTVGFSAGGHLTACLGTLWDEPFLLEAMGERYPVRDGRKLWKPDGMILCYPVITMGEFTHRESRSLLLGENDTDRMRSQLSLEKRVTGKTVPAFLWHTQEDADVPVENSLEFAVALRRCRIPFELHVYEKGGHGMSLCDETVYDGNPKRPPLADNQGWVELSVNWIKRR